MEPEMPDNSSVVVNLNRFERTRRAQASAETLGLLHTCRDLLIEGTARALTRRAEAMENTLLAMADRSPLLDTRSTYYGAQGILNKQANELFAACKDAYCQSFSTHTTRGESPPADNLSELSLVGDQDFELALAVDKATSRLRYHCAEELVALDARIAELLGRGDFAESDNPLGPRALCTALLDSIGRMQIEQNVRLVLFNQFELVLATELASIYQTLNRRLADHGILPDLKAGRKARAQGGVATGGVATGGAATSGTASGGDIFRLFEQIAGGGGAGGIRVPMPGVTGAGLPAPTAGGLDLVDSISQLQLGALALPDGARFELPIVDVSSIQNVLRLLQHSPVMQTASPLDAVLVDAVAMLFDVVFDEAALPDRLKTQIARLQIPVLKAAMLDRDFFSQPDHPVRRMLDAIAALAVHLPDNAAGNARLAAVSAVVGRVLGEFERDIGLFADAADELETLRDSLDETAEEAAATILHEDIEAIRRDERAELAPVVVHDFINRAMKEQELDDSVREFLRRDWSKLLSACYIREGEQGAHFGSHLETMRELVWSVQPKADMDARLMLVRILPGLLKRLRDGVQEIDLAEKIAERFFARLVILHANAVRPNAQPVPLPEISSAEIAAIEAERAEAQRAEAQALAVAEPAAAETEPAPPEFEDAYALRARALEKGDWVEFHYNDGTFRWARLGWIGGVHNTYLFSDQDGMNSFSISHARLADKMRRGEAVIVERKSITESAFGKLMNLFRQKLGHA